MDRQFVPQNEFSEIQTEGIEAFQNLQNDVNKWNNRPNYPEYD